MIARSDAAGLKRAVQSVGRYVDRIVIGVDERSDSETHVQAEALADDYWTFDAAAIGLTDEEWAADKMHFANARNLGRARIQLPWVLVLDTDERLVHSEDLRAFARKQPSEINGIGLRVQTGVITQVDPQRLARVDCRWEDGTHNQLPVRHPFVTADALIDHKIDLRPQVEIDRRNAQRNAAMVAMEDVAEGGDLSAMYHVAKQAAFGKDVEKAVKWVSKYRFATEIHGPAGPDRAHLAFVVACSFFEKSAFLEAEGWALRALLDGPQIESLCLLGDLALLREDRPAALVWFEGACNASVGLHSVPETLELRFRRRAELANG